MHLFTSQILSAAYLLFVSFSLALHIGRSCFSSVPVCYLVYSINSNKEGSQRVPPRVVFTLHTKKWFTDRIQTRKQLGHTSVGDVNCFNYNTIWLHRIDANFWECQWVANTQMPKSDSRLIVQPKNVRVFLNFTLSMSKIEIWENLVTAWINKSKSA